MTDTLAVGSITQLTETGSLTQFAPLARHEVDMAQFAKAQSVPAPDPRDAEIADLKRGLEIKQDTANGAVSVAKQYQHDLEVAQARIAELEAALRDIGTMCIVAQVADDEHLREMFHNVRLFIERKIPPPERGMTITHEELSV